MKYCIIYEEGFRNEELKSLRDQGVKVKVSTPTLFGNTKTLDGIAPGTTLILRGRRLHPKIYSELSIVAQRRNLTMHPCGEVYKFLHYPGLQHEVLKDFGPRSITVTPEQLLSEEVVQSLGQLGLPLFWRTELGSVSKFLGSDATICHDLSKDNLMKIIDDARHSKPMAEFITLRSFCPVAKDNHGLLREARFVVRSTSGALLCDYNNISTTQDVDGFAGLVAQGISHSNKNGDFILDVGESEDGRMIAVEIKNIIDASFRNLHSLTSLLSEG